ncbi:MAG: FkbM family methyltransferase [Crocinitomicaceae bacterium]|nr:FkbM family methyltransferase [Crocinitomicaceae bacterium]
MKQSLYKFIYSPGVNSFLRGGFKPFKGILPNKYRVHPSGKIKLKVGNTSLDYYLNQTNYPGHLVYWDGCMSFEYTDVFVKLIPKVNVFLDVGSNLGYYSMLGCMLNKDIEIVAFEPSTGPLHYLKMNVEKNNLKNVKIAPIALSDKKGEITFYEASNKKYQYLKYNLGGEGNTGSKTDSTKFTKNIVPTTTLDAYVQENKIESIDLIKLDTEGTEQTILQHATEVLKNQRPIVICETLFDRIEKDLESIMKSYGYRFFNYYKSVGLVEVDTIVRKEDDGVRDCFFVHPDKLSLIEEFVVQNS